MSYIHYPVMVEEILNYLVRGEDNFFLDCTLGEGGHALRILKRFPNISVYGIDRNEAILNIARNRLSKFAKRFMSYNSNFVNIDKIREIEDIKFDSILIDLGISSFHYKKSNLGFSFTDEEVLDMRLDEEGLSAYEIINSFSEDELKRIFYEYSEERFASRIVTAIVKERQLHPIKLASELARIVKDSIPKKFQKKRIHPATKVFQALRIVVNNEFDNIKKGIPVVLSFLKKGGRLGVITFHSLEDRIVKKIFNYMYKDCICPPSAPQCICNKKREIIWIKKLLVPSENEVRDNPPSRSAKLRIVEKVI